MLQQRAWLPARWVTAERAAKAASADVILSYEPYHRLPGPGQLSAILASSALSGLSPWVWQWRMGSLVK
jgi:hypothetical protein